MGFDYSHERTSDQLTRDWIGFGERDQGTFENVAWGIPLVVAAGKVTPSVPEIGCCLSDAVLYI